MLEGLMQFFFEAFFTILVAPLEIVLDAISSLFS